MTLDDVVARIRPADSQAKRKAELRQNQLTKPPGSLGRLEALSVQLAGIFRTDVPRRAARRWSSPPPTTGWSPKASPAILRRSLRRCVELPVGRRGYQRHRRKGRRGSGNRRVRGGHAAARHPDMSVVGVGKVPPTSRGVRP